LNGKLLATASVAAQAYADVRRYDDEAAKRWAQFGDAYTICPDVVMAGQVTIEGTSSKLNNVTSPLQCKPNQLTSGANSRKSITALAMLASG